MDCNGTGFCTIQNGEIATFSVDPNLANNWVADVTEQVISAGSNIVINRGRPQNIGPSSHGDQSSEVASVTFLVIDKQRSHTSFGWLPKAPTQFRSRQSRVEFLERTGSPRSPFLDRDLLGLSGMYPK
jgi:hypothetical protein